MRVLTLIFLALGALLQPVFAQVTAEIVLTQEKFLPAEELMVGVRVVNQSGQTLALGDDPDWIEYTIERDDGGVIRKISDPPVQRSFKLESAQRATLSVDLAPCYDLRTPGTYTIAAQVKLKDWGTSLVTKPAKFEIVEGTKIWEQVVGTPVGPSNQPPQIRTYTLQQANYLEEPRLYLRVTGSEGQVIKLINVGRMLSFGRPVPVIDKQSRLHLLQQNGPRTSRYLVIDPDGNLEIRQFYEYTDSRPRLRMDENGNVSVSGGLRRESPEDLPANVQSKHDEAKPKQP